MDGVAQNDVNTGRLASYVELERENQQDVRQLIRELTENLRQEIQKQVQHLDARINVFTRRAPPNRYESQQPRPPMGKLFVSIVVTLVTYNKAVPIDMLFQYQIPFQLLVHNVGAIYTFEEKIVAVSSTEAYGCL